MNTTAAADRQPTLPTGLPDGWLFDHDLPCPTCGYNLRMLGTPRCPECGHRVSLADAAPLSPARVATSRSKPSMLDTARTATSTSTGKRSYDRVDPVQFKHFEYTQRPIRAALRTCFAVLLVETQQQDIRPAGRTAATALAVGLVL